MLPLFVLASAIAFSAATEGPRVGVAPVAVSGDSATPIDEKFGQQVDAALGSAGTEHVMLDPDWAGECTRGECLSAPMGDAGLDFVVAIEVEVIERDYLTTVTVFDATGAQVSATDATCEICTADEAAAAAAEAASGASSGLQVAEAPEPEGPEPEPAPEPVASPGPVDDAQTARYVGWGLTGGGAVLLISGITMIALEEKPYGPRCSDANTDSQGECEFRHKTVEGGTVLTVLGGLAAGAGAALLVVHRKKKNARVALSPFGRGVSIEGSF